MHERLDQLALELCAIENFSSFDYYAISHLEFQDGVFDAL